MTADINAIPTATIHSDLPVDATVTAACVDAKSETSVPPALNFDPAPNNVLNEIEKVAAAAVNDANASETSKQELATILEGFAQVLRANDNYKAVNYADHAAEVAQLKQLLLEAQETIINLLNDRVYDRAKMAKLEAEVRFLPDLQAQAHKAIGLASQSDEVQRELNIVRAEVERLRTAYVRAEQKNSGWFAKLFKTRNEEA